MPTAAIHDLQLYYELHGAGEPVALLNGIMMNTAGWSYQLPALTRDHQVLLHDMRGQGASDKPDAPYTFAQHVADFRALLDHLGIARIHVVGVSYGAEVGMAFALAHPERVASLVIGSATSEVTPLLRAWMESWRVAAQTRQGASFMKLFLPSIYGPDFVAAREAWLARRAEQFQEKATEEWFLGFERLLANFLTLDLTEQLPGIQAPTLVVTGEQDVLKPVAQSRLIAERIPHSEFMILGNCGHVAPWEQAEAFNTAVLGFLAKHRGRP